MSRTTRKHMSKNKLSKQGGRSKVALDAIGRSGAGKHGKSQKQKRANEKAQLRKETE